MGVYETPKKQTNIFAPVKSGEAAPDPKPPTQSLTNQGIALTLAAFLVPLVLKRLGLDIPPDVHAALVACGAAVIGVGLRRAMGGIS